MSRALIFLSLSTTALTWPDSTAAFERAVLASKSYLIALGLVEGFFSVDEAAKAAHVEVQSQIDRWGEVEDSESAAGSLSRIELCDGN